MTTVVRYDDLGTSNSVRLLPKIDSYNGYIQLYTELDSHIEEGDVIFISYSGDTLNLNSNTDVILDNYAYFMYSDSFVYDTIAQGYNVLYVDKNINSFVIDRLIISIPPKSKIYNHYVSRVVCNNITINSGKIDGTLLKKANISGSTIITQCVILSGNILGENLNSKYNDNYVSLSLTYNEATDTYTKHFNLNNNYYGYSYFYDLNSSIIDCNITNGNYYNCSLESSNSGNTISGGYFNSCEFFNYSIYDGYFYKTIKMSESCKWHYGKWDGNTFTLDYWEDGDFINGVFGTLDSRTIWQYGNFFNGKWTGLYWMNGSFINGVFEGIGFHEGDKYTNSEWFNGTFRGGKILNLTGNTISFRGGTISSGEVHNTIINNSDINGGIFYNTTIKNSTINDGIFNVEYNGVSVFNYFNNTKIYGGDFDGVWYAPSLVNNLFFSSVTGLNEFSESTIYNGVFNYSTFYNYNEIFNGDFTDVMFYNSVVVNDGIFKGGKSHTVNGVVERTNIFENRKYNLSQATIRSKSLYYNNNTILDKKMYLEFKNGHNFTLSDTGITITLVGFNSQELYNKRVTISNNNIIDPSKINPSNGSATQIDAIGVDYIIVDEPMKDWFYGDSGMVKKANYEYVSVLPETTIIINNGTYNNTEFYGDINVYNGVYNYVTMRNGINWYNGVFNGNYFQSFSGQSSNNWYGGDFNNGYFGNNLTGAKQTVALSIFSVGSFINNTTAYTPTDDYKLVDVYPLVYERQNTGPITNNINNLESNMQARREVNLNPNRVDINNDNINNTTNNIWGDVEIISNYTWVRNVSYSIGETNMSKRVWSGSTSPILQNNQISPYEFVYKIKCKDVQTKLNLIKYLSEIVQNPNLWSIDIADQTSSLDNGIENFSTFKELYGMDYTFKEYISASSNGEEHIYLIFSFDLIKDMYINSSTIEKNAFNNNFRNVWSIANTGYFTYPMPVLNNNYEDIKWIQNMFIYEPGNIQINESNRTKWIDGSSLPPWWYKVDFSNTPIIFTNDGQKLIGGKNYKTYNISPDDYYTLFIDDRINIQYNSSSDIYTTIRQNYIGYQIIKEKYIDNNLYYIVTDRQKVADSDSIGGKIYPAQISIDWNILMDEVGWDENKDFQFLSGDLSPDLSIDPNLSDIAYEKKDLFIQQKIMMDANYEYLKTSSITNWYQQYICNRYDRDDNVEGVKLTNFQDIVLSSAYMEYGLHKSAIPYRSLLDTHKNNPYTNYFYKFLVDYELGFLTGTDLYVGFTKEIYKYYFSEENKALFKKMNQHIQTNTEFFNKASGIQIYVKNVLAEQSSFKDNWYDGRFYNGDFEGIWYGGQWINGNWFGWNMINTDVSSSAITALFVPSKFFLGTVERQKYVVDYELLKRKKLYYDIAPWDEANNKNTEVVNLPLRKKERKM